MKYLFSKTTEFEFKTPDDINRNVKVTYHPATARESIDHVFWRNQIDFELPHDSLENIEQMLEFSISIGAQKIDNIVFSPKIDDFVWPDDIEERKKILNQLGGFVHIFGRTLGEEAQKREEENIPKSEITLDTNPAKQTVMDGQRKKRKQ